MRQADDRYPARTDVPADDLQVLDDVLFETEALFTGV